MLVELKCDNISKVRREVRVRTATVRFTSGVVCRRTVTCTRLCRKYGERASTTKERATRRRPSNGELHAYVKFLTEYRDAYCLRFSETWLDDTIDSRHLHVDGFGAPVRADITEASGKQKGGGLCFFINERWCNNYTVKLVVLKTPPCQC